MFHLYRVGQFYSLIKPEYTKKNTDLSQFTDKLYYILLYREYLSTSGIPCHNFSGDKHWLHR